MTIIMTVNKEIRLAYCKLSVRRIQWRIERVRSGPFTLKKNMNFCQVFIFCKLYTRPKFLRLPDYDSADIGYRDDNRADMDLYNIFK